MLEPVSDTATALLIAKFYEIHMSERAAPIYRAAARPALAAPGEQSRPHRLRQGCGPGNAVWTSTTWPS
jgi:hypothetical protein